MPNTIKGVEIDPVREKLIELLSQVQYQGNAVHGYSDRYIQNGELADHLIANGVTVQKWIPVSEKPHEHTLVLGYARYFADYRLSIMEVRWDGHHWCDKMGVRLAITHWMPLPEPPKGE